ncbi:hypothetical protein SteCoe_31998 [Stentor coeruleus]|uniref:non-specific serine/threonine protein kinase n=1 Tax=Stentor coeruleus TaxID=5963 RepID=A0A1R2AZY8_9CILI|nr:hypothetical protein SteCoe_31998 [Stentor coeruleus]
MRNEDDDYERREYFSNYFEYVKLEKISFVTFRTLSEKYPRKAVLKKSNINSQEAQLTKFFSETSKFFVLYYESLRKNPNSDVEIFLELCEKGSLRKRLDNCKEEKKFLNKEMILFQFVNLAGALHSSHKTLAHRDIKPDNIFITSNNIFKIGDFDISSIKHDLDKTVGNDKGTYLYMPNKYKDASSGNVFGKNELLEIDIHSFIKTFAETIRFSNANEIRESDQMKKEFINMSNSFDNWFDVSNIINNMGFKDNEINLLNDGFNCSRKIEFSDLKNIFKSLLKRIFNNMTEINYTCYICGECALNDNFIILSNQCINHIAHASCFSGFWCCTDDKSVCPICDEVIDQETIESLNILMKENYNEELKIV